MQLDPTLRRLTAYLYVQDLLTQGEVVELGCTDPRTRQLLSERGCKRVEQRETYTATGLPDGQADVVLALDVDPAHLAAAIAEARRLLKPTGTLVLGCESRDRPGAKSGVSYYELADKLEGPFAAVTMIGQAPFAGATLVEYGVASPEPMLDGTLVHKGERVAWYLAIASAEKRPTGGFSVIQVPLASLPPPAAIAAAPAPVAAAAPAPKPDDRDKALEEFRAAALKHAEAMEAAKAELRERDAYIAELERDVRETPGLREAVRRASDRVQAAEAAERKARLALAQAEGNLLRRGVGAAEAPAPAPSVIAPEVIASSGELAERLQALEAENAKLRKKEEEARTEAWKHMKARSDAEAAASEVRDDTVRKLKDARKLASVELMRAMEEATKKAVGLKEELSRVTDERKAMKAELAQLHAELESSRAAGQPPPAQAVDPAAAQTVERGAEAEAEMEALRGRIVQLERELGEARAAAWTAPPPERVHEASDEAKAERERFGRMIADVEQEAKQRGDAAVRMRATVKEREREVEALRHELADRDARLVALEKTHPPQAEVERMEAELAQARTRLGELGLEIERREAATDRAAAAAAHERARAERLVAEERRAMHDRNEARARAAAAEAQVAGLTDALERARLKEEAESERARKAETEVRERKERCKQLKREVEDAERRAQRAAGIDAVRVRLEQMETTLRGEEQRMALIEDALRRAATEADLPPGLDPR